MFPLGSQFPAGLAFYQEKLVLDRAVENTWYLQVEWYFPGIGS